MNILTMSPIHFFLLNYYPTNQFVDVCTRIPTHHKVVDCFIFTQSEKRKVTSELVFTRSRDIDFRLIN